MPYAKEIDVDLILTTGVIRDLIATGFVEQILNTIPATNFPLQVYEDYHSRNEIQSKQNFTNSDQDFLNNLYNLVDKDLLSLADLKSDEEFHDFSSQTWDSRLPKQRFGAIICGLAKHRKWIVACNDRKTMNLLNTFNPKSRYVTAIDLIKNWTDLAYVDQFDLHQVLAKLKSVNIVPVNSHPHYSWWKNKIKQLH